MLMLWRRRDSKQTRKAERCMKSCSFVLYIMFKLLERLFAPARKEALWHLARLLNEPNQPTNQPLSANQRKPAPRSSLAAFISIFRCFSASAWHLFASEKLSEMTLLIFGSLQKYLKWKKTYSRVLFSLKTTHPGGTKRKLWGHQMKSASLVTL